MPDPGPQAIRSFLRQLVLDPAGRRIVARLVGTSERVAVKALELAASDPPRDEGEVPQSVNVRILTAVMAMPPEIRKRYAETGELPERYWELPGHGEE